MLYNLLRCASKNIPRRLEGHVRSATEPTKGRGASDYFGASFMMAPGAIQ